MIWYNRSTLPNMQNGPIFGKLYKAFNFSPKKFKWNTIYYFNDITRSSLSHYYYLRGSSICPNAVCLSVCLQSVSHQLTQSQQPNHLGGLFWWHNYHLITYWGRNFRLSIPTVNCQLSFINCQKFLLLKTYWTSNFILGKTFK